MLSLVGNYTDSEDEEEEENPIHTEDLGKHQNTSRIGASAPRPTQGQPRDHTVEDKLEPGDAIIEDEDEYFIPRPAAKNFAQQSDDSTDESDDSDSGARNSHLPNAERENNEMQFENPFRSFGSSIAEVSKIDSVFQIQFLEDEQQKSQALQKHVKMTSQPGGNDKINGKKVCWNFRKGKCRFGHNCTFGHDSDLLVTKKASGAGSLNVQSSKPVTIQKEAVKSLHQEEYDPSAVITSEKKKEKPMIPSDDEETTGDNRSDNLKGKKKRKRPGLSQNLTPGKKVMNAYYRDKN